LKLARRIEPLAAQRRNLAVLMEPLS